MPFAALQRKEAEGETDKLGRMTSSNQRKIDLRGVAFWETAQPAQARSHGLSNSDEFMSLCIIISFSSSDCMVTQQTVRNYIRKTFFLLWKPIQIWTGSLNCNILTLRNCRHSIVTSTTHSLLILVGGDRIYIVRSDEIVGWGEYTRLC